MYVYMYTHMTDNHECMIASDIIRILQVSRSTSKAEYVHVQPVTWSLPLV